MSWHGVCGRDNRNRLRNHRLALSTNCIPRRPELTEPPEPPHPHPDAPYTVEMTVTHNSPQITPLKKIDLIAFIPFFSRLIWALICVDLYLHQVLIGGIIGKIEKSITIDNLCVVYAYYAFWPFQQLCWVSR
jgi:hypothetical protein